MKRRRVGGDEEDAYSSYWRPRYLYLQRAGVIAYEKPFYQVLGLDSAEEIP